MLQFAFAKLILHVAAVVRRDAISQKLNVNPIWTSVQCEIFLLFFVFRFRPKKEGLFIFLLFFGQKNTVLFGTFSFSFSAENRNSVFGRPLVTMSGFFSRLFFGLVWVSEYFSDFQY